MIQTLNGSGRRNLTDPAVHPCEAISPSTLLISLINLAREICSYRSKFLVSNKRSGREAIRQIGVLLILLKEIRDKYTDLPDSVVLAFSELHLIFQNVRYLLEDCSRDGSRLLMLMKSELVATKFRVLIWSVSTALDVFPFSLIDLPVEVKEHVQLLMRQARKTRFEVEADDKEVLMNVISLLRKFEDGIVPDKSALNRVLDYLGIKSWTMCNKEVEFLDSEIELEWLSKEKREMTLLSSLMGFMTYCRCVLFDVVDEAIRQTDGGRNSVVLSCLNSDDFRCPISLEFMTDPVIIATGHTYDRSSILKWFKAGNPACPMTGEKLVNKELVPNLVLKRIIQQHCSENGVPFPESGSRKRDITRTLVLGSSKAEQAVKMVAQFLATQLEIGTEEEKNKAAYEIRLLSKTSIFNRSCLVESGSIPHLLILLYSSDSIIQENAIAALLNLSKHSKSKSVIMEKGGLEPIVHVLKSGAKIEAQQHATGTLFYIASIDQYRKQIGENPDAIPVLIDQIKDGSDRSKKNAMVAVFALLMNPGNHWRVLAAGAIPLLVNLLTADREDLVTDSLAILAAMAERPDGSATILRWGALSSILEILDFSTSRAAKEYCVALLLALCVNGGQIVVHILVKSPSLMTSLYSLLSEGTSRASKKASSLIRVLHEFCEKMSPGSFTPFLRQERFIDVW